LFVARAEAVTALSEFSRAVETEQAGGGGGGGGKEIMYLVRKGARIG
jgi:hypothetical protein